MPTITLSTALPFSVFVTTPAIYVVEPPSPSTCNVSGLDGPSCKNTICPVCKPPRSGLKVTVNSVDSSPSSVLFASAATKTELSLTTLFIVIAEEPIFANHIDSDVEAPGSVSSVSVSSSNTNSLVLEIRYEDVRISSTR